MGTRRSARALVMLLMLGGCSDRSPAPVQLADVRGQITAQRNWLWSPAQQITEAGIAMASLRPLFLWRACVSYQSGGAPGRADKVTVIVGAPADGRRPFLDFESSECAGVQYVPFPEIETGFTSPQRKSRLPGPRS